MENNNLEENKEDDALLLKNVLVDKKVENAQNISNELERYLRGIKNLVTNTKKNILPSYLCKKGQFLILECLGVENYNKPKNNAIKMTFQVKEVNDNDGKIILDAVATIENISKLSEIKVSGFIKTKNFLTQKLNILLKKIGNTTTTKNSFLPSEIINSLAEKIYLQSSDLGIDMLSIDDDSVKIYFKHIKSDDENGQIWVKVFLEGDNILKEKEIVIFGYKFAFKQDQDDVKKIIEQCLETYQTNKTTILPSQIINQQKNIKELGVDAITNLFDNDKITTSFEITNHDDEKGSLEILLILKKNQIVATKNIKINGYKKLNVQDSDDIKKYIYNLDDIYTTTSHNIFPQWLQKTTVASWEIGMPPLEVDNETQVSYQIVEIDQGVGSLLVNVTFEKRNAKLNKQVKINGFKNFETFLQEKNTHFEKNLNNQTTSWNDKQASEIVANNKTLSAASLGIKDVMKEDLSEIILDYDVKSFDDVKGEITLDVMSKIYYRIDLYEKSEKIPYVLIFSIKVQGFKKFI